MRWNNVEYQPGTIEVVAYDANGNIAERQTVKTASAPAVLRLEADRHTIKADGNDLSFVTVSLADKDGTFCPTADDNLTFEVSGAGVFKGVCNGDATSLQPFTRPEMKLFSGQLVVVVQSNGDKGQITLTVKDAARNMTKSIVIKAE